MPRKDGRLTPQEQRLAAAQAAVGDVSEAARRAGYSHRNAAYTALARPAVAAEVARIQQERLFNELLPLAVEVHREILLSKTVPAGAKVQAVKLAYDRTLGLQEGADRKPLEQMTAEELAEEVRRIDKRAAEIAGGAKVIDATIVQDVDVLG